jgi:hypothetical protein
MHFPVVVSNQPLLAKVGFATTADLKLSLDGRSWERLVKIPQFKTPLNLLD